MLDDNNNEIQTVLSLKTLLWKPNTQELVSPQKKFYTWQDGYMTAQCDSCGEEFDPECTCGIYHSPHPEALEEYAKYPSSIFALIKLYGWTDRWYAPMDVLKGKAFAIRTWRVRIVGFVADDPFGGAQWNLQRMLAVTEVAQRFQKYLIYPWFQAKDLVRKTWIEEWNIDPYQYTGGV